MVIAIILVIILFIIVIINYSLHGSKGIVPQTDTSSNF